MTELAAIDGGRVRHLKIGERDYTVVPQRQGYLKNRLPGVFRGFADEEISVDSLLPLVQNRSYQLLKVFIPDFMPEWEFAGYGSQTDLEAENYVESADKSPSPPEIMDALKACVEVNGFDLLSHLGKVVDMKMVRAIITREIAKVAERSESSSATSTADTPSTTLTTDDLTSESNGGSPSPESTPSLEPPSPVGAEN